MERRRAYSTDNLTIIPDIKPNSDGKYSGRSSVPIFKDETISEPERFDQLMFNSYNRPTPDTDLRDN